MGLNLRVLDDAIEYIEAHPESWFQADWRCESGMCLAGWIGELNGVKWLTDVDNAWNDYVQATAADQTGLVFGDGTFRRADTHLAEGEVFGRGVCDVAFELIGIEGGDDYGLFDGENTIEDIKRARDTLIAVYGVNE